MGVALFQKNAEMTRSASSPPIPPEGEAPDGSHTTEELVTRRMIITNVNVQLVEERVLPVENVVTSENVCLELDAVGGGGTGGELALAPVRDNNGSNGPPNVSFQPVEFVALLWICAMFGIIAFLGYFLWRLITHSSR